MDARPSSSSSSSRQDRKMQHLEVYERQDTYEMSDRSPTLSQVNVESAVPSTPARKSIWHTLGTTAAQKHPRISTKVLSVWRYARGPETAARIEDPTPLLGRDYSIFGRRIPLHFEQGLVRFTRPLTTPILLLILGAAYIIGFAFLSRAQSFLTPVSSFIGCTSTYWLANDQCGLDGEDCAPFTNVTFDFRCPAQCSYVTLQNPRTVGAQTTVNVPLIVGGGDANRTYRGDSFICSAAMQAGVVSDRLGGCGRLSLVGNYTNFLPTTANGFTSIGFPTVFPLSYRISSDTPLYSCSDLRDPALAYNILILCLLFMVLRPKPIILFWSLISIGFWHVALFSQASGPPPALSDAFGRFLPTLFIGYALWRLAFRFTMPAFKKAPFEGAVWYLGPFWVGVLSNLTFDKVPIDRLTAGDLRKRAGAITALAIIIVIIVLAVINQARYFRRQGKFLRYLGWYIIGGLTVMVLALLPGLQLRIHHYILALILLPLTALPTRLSAVYQGFLLGLFLNGAAAYGFDSILQTADELQGDAPSGSSLPEFLTNSTTFNATIPLALQFIRFATIPSGLNADGYELLIDDVERYSGSSSNFSLASLQEGIPHFFRLAYTSGGGTMDFTNAASLYPNGTWIDPLPGASY